MDAHNRVDEQFQLHHTGIKTVKARLDRVQEDGFQLHHTGIKTESWSARGRS